MPPISGEWEAALRPEFKKAYYRRLFQTVGEEYRKYRIYPPADDIFNAFHFTPLPDVKVVILGQDPYHEEGQAHGLSFSVRPGIEIPPSLVNIYRNCMMIWDVRSRRAAVWKNGRSRACCS